MADDDLGAGGAFHDLVDTVEAAPDEPREHDAEHVAEREARERVKASCQTILPGWPRSGA